MNRTLKFRRRLMGAALVIVLMLFGAFYLAHCTGINSYIQKPVDPKKFQEAARHVPASD